MELKDLFDFYAQLDRNHLQALDKFKTQQVVTAATRKDEIWDLIKERIKTDESP